MPVVEIHEHIESSPDQVWALISDIKKAPEWVTFMRELVSTTDNPVREGTVYRELQGARAADFPNVVPDRSEIRRAGSVSIRRSSASYG